RDGEGGGEAHPGALQHQGAIFNGVELQAGAAGGLCPPRRDRTRLLHRSGDTPRAGSASPIIPYSFSEEPHRQAHHRHQQLQRGPVRGRLLLLQNPVLLLRGANPRSRWSEWAPPRADPFVQARRLSCQSSFTSIPTTRMTRAWTRWWVVVALSPQREPA